MRQINIPTVDAYIDRIQREVPTDELYKTLAEESSELAQAALKMCRVNNHTNPTDKNYEEARHELIEEYTDVLNVAMRVLELEPDWLVGNYKIYRWCRRLDEVRGENSA